jgi:hypothetical protein
MAHTSLTIVYGPGLKTGRDDAAKIDPRHAKDAHVAQALIFHSKASVYARATPSRDPKARLHARGSSAR